MRFAGLTLIFSLLGLSGAQAQGWRAEGEGSGIVAGTVVEGALAGLRLSCADGGIEIRLTHNGAAFERGREHTVIVTVDGVPHILAMQATSGTAGDDFLTAQGWNAAEPLLSALARGREVEVSGPSGRYRLPLSGSARSILALREGCGT